MRNWQCVRKVDRIGNLKIPPSILKKLNILPKTDVVLWLNKENEIVLEKHKDICTFCGAKNNLIKFKKHFVCHDCISNLPKPKDS